MKCVPTEKLTEFIHAILITLFKSARTLLLLLHSLCKIAAAAAADSIGNKVFFIITHLLFLSDCDAKSHNVHEYVDVCVCVLQKAGHRANSSRSSNKVNTSLSTFFISPATHSVGSCSLSSKLTNDRNSPTALLLFSLPRWVRWMKVEDLRGI